MKIDQNDYAILGSKVRIDQDTPVYEAGTTSVLRYQERDTEVTVKAVDRTKSGATRIYWKSNPVDCYTYI